MCCVISLQPSTSPDTAALFTRVTARYRGCGRAAYHYVASKLRWDPVHSAVLALPGEFGTVLDVGCGRGQLGIALLEAGRARAVLGLDCHARHLGQANLAGSGLAFQAVTQDLAVTQNLPEADSVLLVDVLYQLDSAAQRALLQHAAQAARRHVIVRTLDPARGARSALTLTLERALRRVSPNSGATVEPPPVTSLVALLEAAGYSVVVTPCWRGTPFANVLLAASRPTS